MYYIFAILYGSLTVSALIPPVYAEVTSQHIRGISVRLFLIHIENMTLSCIAPRRVFYINCI